MKRLNWQVLLGLYLIILSATFYFIHYAVFRDAHHIFIYLVGDIAFVFIEVLLVTLIIHRLLNTREKRAMLEKMNMVIGAFFSEVGTELLKRFRYSDPGSGKNAGDFIVTSDWSNQKFSDVMERFETHDFEIEVQRENLAELQSFLLKKRSFLLSLLGNANLLEHESFTDLLWAVFHLTEELAHRQDVKQLSDSDYQHIIGDIKRAYTALVSEWLEYMKHLKDSYPYLFSLAVRTNPFDENASPEVK